MSEKLKILWEQFGIECVEMIETFGGLSASAYKVVTSNQCFFLKVYEKKRTQTNIWVENIDRYMPILIQLNTDTHLKGKIVNPMTAKDGRYLVEDDENVYVLFEFIEGETIARKPLTEKQTIEIAEIIAYLHKSNLKISAENQMRENFEVPFCVQLDHFFENEYPTSAKDLRAVIDPYLNELIEKNDKLKMLAKKISGRDVQMVLCHTDAHGFNLMQSKGLVLVDWEGMKLAPAEADLFMFVGNAYQDVFMETYQNIHPQYEIDQEMLDFYSLRRKIEDIWAFLERILYDELSEEQRIVCLEHILRECKNLNASFRL